MPGLISFLTGPPAAGKSTIARQLAERSSLGMVVPVDDMRLWVLSGLADSVPWTMETERQFQVAESAACAVARIYADQGFEVVVDHCRNLARLDELISIELRGYLVKRILLLPDLATNLARNATRMDKSFDPNILSDTIENTHKRYRQSTTNRWTVIDSSSLTPDQTVDHILDSAIP